jgi:CheY-like chemotaxis protein
MILRSAGYAVDEAYTVEMAIKLVDQDSVDVALVCHTIPRPEQNVLISTIRAKRRLMPILCIRSYAFETVPPTCIAIENEPEALLNALRQATRAVRPDSIV